MKCQTGEHGLSNSPSEIYLVLAGNSENRVDVPDGMVFKQTRPAGSANLL
jgi:hypothetical protein